MWAGWRAHARVPSACAGAALNLRLYSRLIDSFADGGVEGCNELWRCPPPPELFRLNNSSSFVRQPVAEDKFGYQGVGFTQDLRQVRLLFFAEFL